MLQTIFQGQKNSINPSGQVVGILKLCHLHHVPESKKDTVQAENTYTVNHFKLEGTYIISTQIPLVKTRHVTPHRDKWGGKYNLVVIQGS